MSSEQRTPEKSFDEVFYDTFINLFTCNIGSPAPLDDSTTYHVASRSDHEIARDKYRQNLLKSNNNSSSLRPPNNIASLEEHNRKLKQEEEFKLHKDKEFNEKVSNETGVLSFFGLTSSSNTQKDDSTINNSTDTGNMSVEQFEYFLGTEGVEAIIWLPTPKGKAKGKTAKIKLDRLTNSIRCEMVSKGEKKSLFFQLTDLLAVSNGKGNGSTGTMAISLPPEADDYRSLYITIKEKPELNLTFPQTSLRDTFVKGMRLLINKASSVGNSNAAQAQFQTLLNKVKK